MPRTPRPAPVGSSDRLRRGSPVAVGNAYYWRSQEHCRAHFRAVDLLAQASRSRGVRTAAYRAAAMFWAGYAAAASREL